MNIHKQEDYIPKLKVITGGKDNDITPPKDNWLRDLPKQTVFISQPKGVKVEAELWFIIFKFTHFILLGSNVHGEMKRLVNDIEFSKSNILGEVIEFGKEDLETGVETLYVEDGNSNSSDPRGLAVDADDPKG